MIGPTERVFHSLSRGPHAVSAVRYKLAELMRDEGEAGKVENVYFGQHKW